MQPAVSVQTTNLVHWFNALRNLPDSDRSRALDAFWAGQIDSKAWLVTTLNNYVAFRSNIYIFGGWIGVLANLLFCSSTYPINKIRSIDLDPWCEGVADTLNKQYEMDDWRFKAVTADMAEYNYQADLPPQIVVNTSTEHITQDAYDMWWDKIPSGTLVVLQGNNFFSCPEHCRCSSSLSEFMAMNKVQHALYSGSLEHDLYTRYMTLSVK